MKYKVVRKGYLESLKKEKNEYWLNEWIKKRRNKRQKRFIEWLRSVVPNERWDIWGEKRIVRFVNYIDVRCENECWNWNGSVSGSSKKGYGYYHLKGKMYRAHRLIYILINGEIPKDKPFILHNCNNSLCCNPNHLDTGTHDDNMKYRDESGRTKAKQRIKTDEEIRKIREEYNTDTSTTYDSLGKKYNVSAGEIDVIVNNEIMKDENYVKTRIGLQFKSKLTWIGINQIRELYKTRKYTQKQLGTLFGVCYAQINNIVNNKCWFDTTYQYWLDKNTVIVKGKRFLKKYRGDIL